METTPANQRIKGTYYIRVRSAGWYVWYKYYEDGKSLREKVDSKAIRDLGFRNEMSVDEAKAHCTQLNKERSLRREKIRKSAKRVTELKTINETLFPQERVAEFQELLSEENFGSDIHLKKLNSHFNFIQNLCNDLRIMPDEYRESAKKIYKYFIKKKVSPNYAGRLISLLNRWGKFVSKINGTFFEEVLVPRGRERSAIADAQQTKSGKDTELGVRTESRPLTPEILNNAKDKLKTEQYNWLYLSVWLGLRPEEVELLKDSKRFKIEYYPKKKVQVLHVYQSKLQSISADKRWKFIPIIFSEQQVCLDIIQSGNFKKPIYKIMRKYIGNGISLYGGRKGFVDLMLSRDQKLEDISMWLGHKDISTTWAHYKDKNEINYTQTPETHLKLVK